MYTDHPIAVNSKGMLQHFYPPTPLYHPACYHIMATYLLLDSVSLHSVTPASFPLFIISFYSEGQPLIPSLRHSLRAFTPWWAVILLQWQHHVSIRCNYFVVLPRGSLVDIKGLRITLAHLIVRRVGTADRRHFNWLFFCRCTRSEQQEPDLDHWAVSQQSNV